MGFAISFPRRGRGRGAVESAQKSGALVPKAGGRNQADGGRQSRGGLNRSKYRRTCWCSASRRIAWASSVKLHGPRCPTYIWLELHVWDRRWPIAANRPAPKCGGSKGRLALSTGAEAPCRTGPRRRANAKGGRWRFDFRRGIRFGVESAPRLHFP